jgi:hypothetical protein
MIPYFPSPPPCTHKLKAGIAYSVVAVVPIKYLMIPIIFFYSFAILTDVNGAMLTAGRRVWNNSRSPINDRQEIANDRRKSMVSNLKKQGKSWLPITMIGNFGNIISGPVDETEWLLHVIEWELLD